jgi:oligosaccharide repeat unit polymerase
MLIGLSALCLLTASLVIAAAASGLPRFSAAAQNEALVAFLAALTVSNYWIGGRNVLYPGFLFSALWAFTLGLYAWSPVDIDQIGVQTQIFLASCVALFAVGCFLGSRLPQREGKSVQPPQAPEGSLADGGRIFMTVCAVAILPLFFRDIVNIAGGFGPDLIARARLSMLAAAVTGNQVYSSPIVRSAPNLAVLGALLVFVDVKRGHRASRFLAPILIVVALIYGILTTGRPQLVQLSTGITAIWIFRQKQHTFLQSVRRVAVPLGCLVLLLAVVPLLTKAQASDAGTGSNFAGNLFVQYIIGNVAAFDVLFKNPPAVAHTYTYFPIQAGWNQFWGLSGKGLEGWFVSVPFPMNTYTVFRAVFFDFGFKGPLLFATFLGFCHGILYKRAIAGSAIFVFLYAAYLSPMVMSIFDDMYTGDGILHQCEILLAAAVYFLVLRDFSWKRQWNMVTSFLKICARV